MNDSNHQFQNIKALVFDLDGTLYKGNEAMPYAVATLSYLREKKLDIFYLTNNSTKTPAQIKIKLEKLGFTPEPEKIYSSLSASIYYLKENNIQKIYCVGAHELIDELRSNNMEVLDDTEDISRAEVVLVGMDINFSYTKMAEAYKIFQLNPACKLIACNRDKNYPVENGLRLPGCGPCIAAIETAVGRNADYVVGKPDLFMLKLLCDQWNLNKNEVLLVGDTLESDVAMADSFGCMSVLISDTESPGKNSLTIQSIQTMQKWF